MFPRLRVGEFSSRLTPHVEGNWRLEKLPFVACYAGMNTQKRPANAVFQRLLVGNKPNVTCSSSSQACQVGKFSGWLFSIGGCIRESRSCFAYEQLRECTTVHDRRGAVARHEIDHGAPPPVVFLNHECNGNNYLRQLATSSWFL